MIEKQEFVFESIDEQQTMNFISSYIIPTPIQKLLRELNDENINPHPVIRFHAMSLVYCVLRKIKQILKHCTEHCRHKETVIASLEIQIDHFLNKVPIHFFLYEYHYSRH